MIAIGASPRTYMGHRQRLTLLATGLGLFMVFLDAQIVNVALPTIQARYAVGEAGLQWVVATYSLGMAVSIMTAATLADLRGRRQWYLIGIAAFTLASIVCGLAPSFEVLNVARGVQGVAAATVNVTSLALVSAAFSDTAHKARAIGIWTAIANLGTALGPTLGGILVEQFGWRSIFLANVPVGVSAVYLSLRYVAESRDERPRQLDVPGQGLFMVTIGALACALIQAPQAGWGSPFILALFAAAAIGCLLFVRVEQVSADPMMDVSLFRNPTYALAIGTIWSVFFAIYGMLLVATQYLQTVRGYSPEQTGLMLLPFSAAIPLVSPVVGHLVNRFGVRPLVLSGLSALIFGLLALVAGGHDAGAFALLGLALIGSGVALCVTPITTLAMTSVPPQRAGMAAGIMSAQRALGSTVGFAVLGTVLAMCLSAELHRDLAPLVPDPAERGAIAAAIVSRANPHAPVADLVPRQAIAQGDPAMQEAITAAAVRAFAQGSRVALLTAVALLSVVLLVGLRWFPRGYAAPRRADGGDPWRATSGE